MKKYEKEFRAAHPETIGETDREFDNGNYTEWLEVERENLLNLANVTNHVKIMEYYLAEVTAPSGRKWYELVKDVHPDKARRKVLDYFGEDYNVEISAPIE